MASMSTSLGGALEKGFGHGPLRNNVNIRMSFCSRGRQGSRIRKRPLKGDGPRKINGKSNPPMWVLGQRAREGIQPRGKRFQPFVSGYRVSGHHYNQGFSAGVSRAVLGAAHEDLFSGFRREGHARNRPCLI